MTDLRSAVFTALENALANGYDPTGLDPAVVAADLERCDADLGGRTYAELIPAVVEWQKGRER